jgi:hypothetical protein
MHFGSILEHRNLVYYFMGQFWKRVYVFRKYSRIPESGILIRGLIFETCICISEVYWDTGIQ